MKEAVFLKRNKEKWKKFEQIVSNTQHSNPDELAEVFIALTDDLAYAQTYYPKSRTTFYLNHLTANIHQTIYRNKKEEKGRFIKFWGYELPYIFHSAHKQLLYSFLVFAVAALIGIVSTAEDDTFIRLILGDTYVNRTLENIERGDPMAVYKSSGQVEMFLGITLNNIMVSFKAFVWGGVIGNFPVFLLLSGGTAFLLLYNGIMLGAFQYFFYQKGLFWYSASVIWLHGTLEISAIVIAGCAGFVMGNALLFPKTYSRLYSFQKGAIKGLKIIIGLVPIFITAGFIESFITRYADMPLPLKLLIIFGSAAFIVYYFIIYPIQINKNRS